MEDSRALMQYHVIENHSACISSLRMFDVCGVNWKEDPWPHFSGNFWWARSEYVASLRAFGDLPPPVRGWDLRHQCERWIGSGDKVRACSLHQSHVDHYHDNYPPDFYSDPGLQIPARPQNDVSDEAASVAAVSMRLASRKSASEACRIAILFDNSVRKDTTGVYCLNALRKLAKVSHYLPHEQKLIPADAFDLFIFIDDGIDWRLERDLHPSVFWAIDTHFEPERVIRRALQVDFGFAAQKDGVNMLRSRGVNCMGWLPLACDPLVHRQHQVVKSFDVCFVARMVDANRRNLALRIRDNFPKSFVGERYFDEMAVAYSASRVVLNASIRNDVNMRVFEALACGSMLLTNELPANGLPELFSDGQHLVTYRNHDDMMEKIAYYASHDSERELIAEAGRTAVLSGHTYYHRMRELLNQIRQQRRSLAGCVLPFDFDG